MRKIRRDSTDQVVIYHIRPSGTACGNPVCVGWGEINLAYDKPCQDSDHMNAYPIDGQTVYVNDFFEKYPEAPANYVLFHKPELVTRGMQLVGI